MTSIETNKLWTAGLILTTTLGAASLSACAAFSDSPDRNSSSTPAPVANCLPLGQHGWTRLPAILKPTDFASQLKVPKEDFSQRGRYGRASCDHPILVDNIRKGHLPVVSVFGEGNPCIVIRPIQKQGLGTTTRGIFAACANQA
jgi:hypothetical protein